MRVTDAQVISAAIDGRAVDTIALLAAHAGVDSVVLGTIRLWRAAEPHRACRINAENSKFWHILSGFPRCRASLFPHAQLTWFPSNLAM